MNTWLLPALGCLAFWGLSRFFPKLATQHIDAKSALIFEATGEFMVAIGVLVLIGFKPSFDLKGTSFAFTAGLLGALGVYCYLLAAQRGNVTQLVAVSALYPVITVLLGFFVLGETVSIRQGVGMCLSLIAIVLVAG